MTTERRRRAEEVQARRLKGHTFDKIATELGISKTQAHADYNQIMAERRGQTARNFLTEALDAYRYMSRVAITAASAEPTLENLATAGRVIERALRAHGVWELPPPPDMPEEGMEEGAEFAELLAAIRGTAAAAAADDDADDAGEEVAGQ